MPTPEQKNTDRQMMRRALRLARRGWGRTSPNPMVGALVLGRAGQIVGRGFHRQAGQPHAEINALREAGRQADGGTLYVTLEPCSTHGRTPPCTEAIARAGLRRLVVGTEDPNPKHAGRGLAWLRERGLEVESGIEEESCRRLNQAFFCWIREQRPFTILKLALTLDGRIATVAGDSKWITGEAARKRVQKMRQWCDAIMVGGETVRRDNPRLTVRTPPDWSPQPLPVIYSHNPDFSPDLNLFSNPRRPPLVVAPDSPAAWRQTMRELGARQITALLLEGGGELAAAALQAGVVDLAMFFVAPKILGGRNSRPAVGGADPTRLAEALQLSDMAVERVGCDLLITGTPPHVHRTD